MKSSLPNQPLFTTTNTTTATHYDPDATADHLQKTNGTTDDAAGDIGRDKPASSSDTAKPLTRGQKIFLVIIFAGIPIVYIGVLIVLVILMPNPPGPNYLQDFVVKDVVASPFNVSSTQITAGWNITFNITDLYPWSSLSYDKVEVSIMSSNYADDVLWRTNHHSFNQTKDKRTPMQAFVAPSLANLTNTNISSSLASNLTSNLPIYVDLSVFTNSREDRAQLIIWREVIITCKYLKIEFSSWKDGGVLSNKPITCTSSELKPTQVKDLSPPPRPPPRNYCNRRNMHMCG